MTTRNLVALILFVVAGLPLIGNAWLQYRGDLRRDATARDELLTIVANDITNELQARVDGALENARADGSLPALAQLVSAAPTDSESRLLVNRYLTAIGSRDPVNITSVGLLDVAGRVRADTVAGEVGRDESVEPYVESALRLGTPQWVGPHARAGETRAGLYVAAPLRNAPNPPMGLLRIRLEPAVIGQILEANLRLHRSLGAVILDQQGQAFAHAGLALNNDLGGQGRSPQPDTLHAANGDALARVVGRELRHSGWRLLVFEPETVHRSHLQAKFDQWLAYLGLLALLLLSAALLIGWLLARPLVRLTQRVDGIAAGDLQSRIRPGGTVELRHLGEAVNAMNARLAESLSELQALTGDLEQRVQQRTAELEHSTKQLSMAMEQLVQSEKLAALGSLVAGVAHELNTPIGNALTAATALHSHLRRFERDVAEGPLRRSVLTRLIDEGEEASTLVERNLHRAAELIGNFKQVAVDQTSTRRRRFQLCSTVEEVLSTLHPRLKRLPHSVQLELPPNTWMDSYPGPFEQVLTNLICNSLDHAFGGDAVGIMQISATVQADRVRLCYQDNGVGIPLKLQSRVFDPFFTTRLGQGGSGLGLYLVYSLVTGPLGGQIILHSTPGAGTRFELDLPACAPVAATSGVSA